MKLKIHPLISAAVRLALLIIIPVSGFTVEIDQLLKLANQGDPKSQCELAWRYFRGEDVATNRIEATKWWRKAAEQGHPESQVRLGNAYHSGFAGETNLALALTWYRKAAEQGDAKGLFMMGLAYGDGTGVAKDSAKSMKWYRQAAEKGFSAAQNNLGYAYKEGKGVAKDLAESLRWYLKAAEQGDVVAQSIVAKAYRDGEGVPSNESEANDWFRKVADSHRKGAEQGNASSQWELGNCYNYGNGVKPSRVEALKWYRKAAEQGDASIQCIVAQGCRDQNGTLNDSPEAAKWYRHAAEQGHETSMYMLGFLLLHGDGIPQNRDEAMKWLKRAAAKGHSLAQEVLSNSSQKEKATGTGFFISDDGYFVSNEHVVRNATQVRVLTAEEGLVSAKILKIDAANDLALLKVEGRSSALPVVSSRGMKLGRTVATVGFPNVGLQGFAPKLAKGEIASLSGAQDDARYFQISVPVQPGNSGGALVDERGNVVGVVSAKLNARAALSATGALPENVNYAVKSSYLLSFLESVPEVTAKLKEPNTKEMKFEDVVKSAEKAAVLVLVY